MFDVHGNVCEWCFDFYGEYLNQNKSNLTLVVKNPSGAESRATRICRGGGGNDFAKHLRCAYRSSELPEEKSASRGFRIARNAK